MRRTLARLRSKALAGQLTLAEFQKVQGQAGKHTTPLRALLRALRAAKRRAAAVSALPADVSANLDRLVSRVEHMLGLARRVVAVRQGALGGGWRGFQRAESNRLDFGA